VCRHTSLVLTKQQIPESILPRYTRPSRMPIRGPMLPLSMFRNQTLPHHGGNCTSPTNNTAATPTASRVLPVNPLKAGGTVVVDIVRPPAASNVEIPVLDAMRRDESSTSTSASETQPAPTQKHSHPHRPIDARRAQHRRVIIGESPQLHPKADLE